MFYFCLQHKYMSKQQKKSRARSISCCWRHDVTDISHHFYNYLCDGGSNLCPVVVVNWSSSSFCTNHFTFYFRQEIQQLRNSVLRQKEKLEKKPSEEKKYSEEKKPELRNSGCQTHGRGGSFRRQKRERWAESLSLHEKLIKIHLKVHWVQAQLLSCLFSHTG